MTRKKTLLRADNDPVPPQKLDDRTNSDRKHDDPQKFDETSPADEFRLPGGRISWAAVAASLIRGDHSRRELRQILGVSSEAMHCGLRYHYQKLPEIRVRPPPRVDWDSVARVYITRTPVEIIARAHGVSVNSVYVEMSKRNVERPKKHSQTTIPKIPVRELVLPDHAVPPRDPSPVTPATYHSDFIRPLTREETMVGSAYRRRRRVPETEDS